MSTLFHIDQDLAALYDQREECMALVIVDAAGEDQRREAVRSIDLAISERLRDLDRKVDGIAYLCKELTARATAHKAEGKRLTDMAKHEEATAAEIKIRAAEVLTQRVAPEVISAASQGSNLLKLQGKHNTLSLRKSPPAVMVDDESLLPDEVLRATVTMDYAEWRRLYMAYDIRDFKLEVKPTPRLSEIAARLRERVPCGICLQSMGRRIDGPGPCPECGGTGQVLATVPGAHLQNYNTYVVVK